jgi:DNA-binding CsgD family transcriptional regulator
MGAVEHLKTLCCLGLPPESAMIAVTPLLHEIIPHGATRLALLAPDATLTNAYAENPATGAIYQHFWRFMDDPTSLASLWNPVFRAVGIGWTLHRQGGAYLQSGYYREVEAPLDSCWILDAMIGDGGRTFAGIQLTRPRSMRPFTVDDVQRLDRMRPWLAYAFRRSNSCATSQEDEATISTAGPTVLSAQLIATADARLVYQTASLQLLLRILTGAPLVFTRYVPVRDELPAPVRKLLRQITGATNGTSHTPPRMQVSTAYGVLTLEAKWLVPVGALPEDVARDPKGCLVAVTIELHEHPIAHAARILRDRGATPSQVKVGIQLALGKSKPLIARELGIETSSVADLTKKLYAQLDVHSAAELGLKVWLVQEQDEARQNLRRAG